MIKVNDKKFKTLKDKFYINGERVVEAYVDGIKVYPVPNKRYSLPPEVPSIYGVKIYVEEASKHYDSDELMDCSGTFIYGSEEMKIDRVAFYYTFKEYFEGYYIPREYCYVTCTGGTPIVGAYGSYKEHVISSYMTHTGEWNGMTMGRYTSSNGKQYYKIDWLCNDWNNSPENKFHNVSSIYDKNFRVIGINSKICLSNQEAIDYVTHNIN